MAEKLTVTPTIGLEIHAQLNTDSKMFCSCKNDPEEREPNINICPVCMGHPGTLPVINEQAVKHVLTIGHALEAECADFTEFDRKHYFYPDIPKGYQISQYKFPLVKGGVLNNVAITRIHLEEDTARSGHDEGEGSRIDFNRSGVPLMELVTEPVIKSGEEAGRFARELQLLIRYLGIGNANMEKGEMRVEANLSVSPDENFGTKVEVKNLNSFRSVEKAIQYEIERHTKALEQGEKIVQETRGWDEVKEETFSQRSKEESHDYRYFPEPDLPPLKLSELPEFSKEELMKDQPELPWKRRERYASLGVKDNQIETLVSTPELALYFDAVLDAFTDTPPEKQVQLASNYITTDLVGLMKESGDTTVTLSPECFSRLILLIDDGSLSSRGGKDVLAYIYAEENDPYAIAEKHGLLQSSDKDELEELAKKVIEANPGPVEEYRGGKEASLQFLIGQGMKESKGSANPKELGDILKGLMK